MVAGSQLIAIKMVKTGPLANQEKDENGLASQWETSRFLALIAIMVQLDSMHGQLLACF